MDLSGYNVILAPLGVISAVATTWYSILEVKKQFEKTRKAAANEILEEAKLFDKVVKEKLEAKIDLLETQVNNFKASLSNDLDHLKETQANEIKNLATKVEQLREELREGHSNLIQLLTKLVNKS